MITNTQKFVSRYSNMEASASALEAKTARVWRTPPAHDVLKNLCWRSSQPCLHSISDAWRKRLMRGETPDGMCKMLGKSLSPSSISCLRVELFPRSYMPPWQQGTFLGTKITRQMIEPGKGHLQLMLSSINTLDKFSPHKPPPTERPGLVVWSPRVMRLGQYDALSGRKV